MSSRYLQADNYYEKRELSFVIRIICIFIL